MKKKISIIFVISLIPHTASADWDDWMESASALALPLAACAIVGTCLYKGYQLLTRSNTTSTINPQQKNVWRNIKDFRNGWDFYINQTKQNEIKKTLSLPPTAVLFSDDQSLEKFKTKRYKIHLMPDLSYNKNQVFDLHYNVKDKTRIALAQLLQSIPEIAGFKLLTPYHESQQEIDVFIKDAKDRKFAPVVIYVWGKQDAQIVLNTLFKAYTQGALKGIPLAQGDSLHTPRYNRTINDFIYYAQGHGDDKDELGKKHEYQKSEYFKQIGYYSKKDTDLIHYKEPHDQNPFFYHLNHPDPMHPSHEAKRKFLEEHTKK